MNTDGLNGGFIIIKCSDTIPYFKTPSEIDWRWFIHFDIDGEDKIILMANVQDLDQHEKSTANMFLICGSLRNENLTLQNCTSIRKAAEIMQKYMEQNYEYWVD